MDNEYTLIDFIKDFENRKGLQEENKLFYYLDYAVSDENFNEIVYQRKNDALYRYDKVNKILENTSQDVINSNIYLKKCKKYFTDSKEECIDLLLEHKSDNSEKVSKRVSTEEILPTIDDPELLGLEIVQTYNKVATELIKMYNEIARLNMWKLISKEKCNFDNIATVCIKDKDGISGTLTATFQNNNNINSYLGYVKKNSK